jgi:hypothetical protein
MRGLFDYMGAMDDAYRLLIDARRVEKVTL